MPTRVTKIGRRLHHRAQGDFKLDIGLLNKLEDVLDDGSILSVDNIGTVVTLEDARMDEEYVLLAEIAEPYKLNLRSPQRRISPTLTAKQDDINGRITFSSMNISESAIKCEPGLRIAYIPIDIVGLDLDSKDRNDPTALTGFMEIDEDTANLTDMAENIKNNVAHRSMRARSLCYHNINPTGGFYCIGSCLWPHQTHPTRHRHPILAQLPRARRAQTVMIQRGGSRQNT